MINKKFIEDSNKLILNWAERKIGVWNGNIIIYKVKVDRVTKGGILLPDEAREVDDYHNGLGRIIAVADNVDPQYKVGMYVFHSHEARYKVYDGALHSMLGTVVEKDTIFSIQDNNIILTRSAEEMHNDSSI